jgi:hypothetical protein
MIDSRIRVEGRGDYRDAIGTILKVADDYVSVLLDGETSPRLFSRAVHGRQILREGDLSGYRLTDTIRVKLEELYPVSSIKARPERPVEAYVQEDPGGYGRIYGYRESSAPRNPDVQYWLDRLRDAQYPRPKTFRLPIVRG